MNTSIVIGTLFGDEGKGMTVDWLVKKSRDEGRYPTVIRFGGGHQCGHRVVHKDEEHIFSNFGSGTLRDAPTYWAKGCTIDPVGFMNEYKTLRSIGVQPIIFADPECLITTPTDIEFNHTAETIYKHGSTGVGFGATISRNEGTLKLRLIELRSPLILNWKIYKISDNNSYLNEKILEFRKACEEMLCVITIMSEDIMFKNPRIDKDYIFEGSQGILLDHEYGFFPHVTRSNTMSRGAGRILYYLDTIPTIYYVTRAYGTRHGNGPLPGEKHSDRLHLVNNEKEANKSHEWQGKFRTAPINLDLLDYAIDLDLKTKRFNILNNKLIVTCCDHIDMDKLPIIMNDRLRTNDVKTLFGKLKTVSSERQIFTDSPTWSSK